MGYSLEEVGDRFNNKERPYGPKQLRRDAAAKEISVEDLFKFLKDQSRRGKCRHIPKLFCYRTVSPLVLLPTV